MLTFSTQGSTSQFKETGVDQFTVHLTKLECEIATDRRRLIVVLPIPF